MHADPQPRDVLLRRLAVQRLTGQPLGQATDVVRLLTCVQSQEFAHALWSLGLRSGVTSQADTQREFDAGRFVRTHVLRPTWHLVAAEDLRWVLQVTSARVQQINGSRYRQLGLDRRQLDRGADVLTGVLRGTFLTRPELGDALRSEGIDVTDQRLAYLVMNAELEALICSGPLRGAQHTYALVSERLPAQQPWTADDALAELTWRFFAGHGPAGLSDLTRWSSLTVATATRGLEMVGDRLTRMEVAGQALWFDGSAPEPAGDHDRALLLPLYDEATLSYPRLSFGLTPGHPHPPGTDLFVGSVILDAVNVGTWRRTVRGRTVLVETRLAAQVSASGRTAVAEAVAALASFLGKRLEHQPG